MNVVWISLGFERLVIDSSNNRKVFWLLKNCLSQPYKIFLLRFTHRHIHMLTQKMCKLPGVNSAVHLQHVSTHTHAALVQRLQSLLVQWYIKSLFILTTVCGLFELPLNSHKLTCMIYSWYVNMKPYNSTCLEWKQWRIYVTPHPASKQTLSHLSVCVSECVRDLRTYCSHACGRLTPQSSSLPKTQSSL